jgi:hypothetical protein
MAGAARAEVKRAAADVIIIEAFILKVVCVLVKIVEVSVGRRW